MKANKFKGLFSSWRSDWRTPKDVYDQLDREFNFDFDPCPINPNFDGLTISWKERNFVNPPYGNILPKWIEKSYNEAKQGKLVVMLIPSRTDTRYFHRFILPFCCPSSANNQIVWAAGIIDGEGCIRIQQRQPTPNNGLISPSCTLVVRVKMSHQKTVEKLRDIFDIGYLGKESRKCTKGKTMYIWSAYGDGAIEILRSIYPFCITKEKEIFIALEWASLPKKNTGSSKLKKHIIDRNTKYFELLKQAKISNLKFIPVHTEIRFIKGRLKFSDYHNSAPFPSAIVIFGMKNI